MLPPPEDVAILTATRLEAWAARRRLGPSRVYRVGLACSRGLPEREGPTVLCGLCGALDPTLRPGDVVIADSAVLPGQDPLPCDLALTDRLEAGARALGLRTVRGPVLTSRHLVTGAARQQWSGYLAADMEAALVLEVRPLTAMVRVVLDTPAADLSADWERPGLASLTPRRWGELLRLAREAPGGALRAAAVVQAGLTPPRS